MIGMTRSCFVSTLLSGFAVAWFAPAMPAAAESPADLYQEALARERSLRRPGVSPAAGELRAAIAAYESIVRSFPASGYVDRALWQAAGLAVEAYGKHRDGRDLETGKRLLRQLAQSRRGSSFAERVKERRSQLIAFTQVARLTAIDREVWDDVVRVVMRLDREVEFHWERLARPDRLFFDFPQTDVSDALRGAPLTFDDEQRIVHGIRLGQHPDRTVRVVVDTTDADGCEVITVRDPYRVAVDCRRPQTYADPDGAATPAPAALMTAEAADESTWSMPQADDRGALSLARQLGLQISRIVIDPGHGGHDPGARSHGLREAEVVLDIALRLERRLLTQPGIEVVLTRRDNTYVPLTDRTALANREQADLFLSIHANASRKANVRGVETYFLNFAPDPSAERIAARENVAGGGVMNNLGDLLETIASNSKANESRDFAAVIQDAMVTALRRADPDVPDLGVKQAPFIVLIGARMPSVLAEISFLTNSRDAGLLSSDDYRDLIADALFEGVLRYRGKLHAVTRLARQTAGPR